MANTGSRVMDASKQLPSADWDRMSALDMALFGKALASEEDVIGSSVDFEDKDWKMIEETAKSGGVGSWFASRVDFRVNGTRIRGKKGYSVGGGIVPLFDGAAIDLKKAKMTAPKKNQAESDPIGGSPDKYQNWVVGTGGQLVLAPSGVQNVVPFRMDQIVVTEKGVMGKADKSFRFIRGDEEITGEGLVLKGNYAILYGVEAKKEHENEPVHNCTSIASITGAGLQLYYVPKPKEETEQETTPEETVQDHTAHVNVEKNASNSESGTLLEKIKDSALEKLKGLGEDILSGEKTVGDVGGQILEEARALWKELNGDDLKNAWASIPEVCRRYLYDEMSEDEVKSFMERLAPGDSLMKLLGMNGNDEQELGNPSGKGSFPMAKIPLFPPFLDFTVELSPEYSFSAYLKGDVHGLYNIWKKGEGETTDITLDAGLRGHMSMEASAMLSAGVSYLINVEAGLFAKASLDGSLDAAKTFLKGGVKLSLKKAGNGEIILADDIKTEVQGGVKLEGSVGAKGVIQSQIMLWSKNLFTYEFYKWNLAEFSMNLALSKSKEDRGLVSGWKVNEANFAVNGIMGEFLDKNGAKTKYGFNPSKMEEKAAAGYEEAEKAFQEALLWLEEFRQTRRVVGVEPESKESGLYKVSDIGIEVQKKFLNAWTSAQINLETQTNRLKELESHAHARKKAEEGIQKHQRRLEQLKEYYERYWDKDGKIKGEAPKKTVMEYYKGLDGNPGAGFERAMQRKAEEKIYTYDRIVAYEKKRHEEIVEKKYNKKFVRQHKAFFANADMLEAYEKKCAKDERVKLEEQIKGLTKSLGKLKAERKSATNADKLNEKFIKKYVKNISDDELLQYGYSSLLLHYVGDTMKKLANQEHAMDALMSTRANKEALKDNKAAAIKQYLSVKMGSTLQTATPSSLMATWGEDIYRTASADDLIQLEQEHIMQYGEAELQTFLQTDRKKTISPAMQKKNAELKKRYKEWIASKVDGKNTGLIPYLTLELLLQYEEQRYIKQQFMAQHIERKNWLKLRLGKVNSSAPEKARELEEEYIQEYFKTFSQNLFFKDLKTMKFVDLRLLMLSQTEARQQRIEALEKAKMDGKSVREIWEIYEEMGGSRTEVTERQKEKLRDNETVTLDDIERFETFTISEMFAVSEKANLDDWYKYEKMSQMTKEQYQDMLAIYSTMGKEIKAGYVEKLKNELGEGRLKKEGGSVYTPEDILEKKKEFLRNSTHKHQDRLDLITSNKERMSYMELLALYNGRTNQDREGAIGAVHSLVSSTGIMTWTNGFEKYLEGTAVDPEQIQKMKESIGAVIDEKHYERIQELTRGEAPTEEEKNARVQAYLEKAEGFKTEKDIREEVAKEQRRLLFEPDAKKMYENIEAYEEGRKKSFEETLSDWTKPVEEAKYLIEKLTENISFCHSVIGNFEEIKANPKAVWNGDKYNQFKQMAEEIKAYEEKERGIETINKGIAEIEKDITIQEEYEMDQDMLEDHVPLTQ